MGTESLDLRIYANDRGHSFPGYPDGNLVSGRFVQLRRGRTAARSRRRCAGDRSAGKRHRHGERRRESATPDAVAGFQKSFILRPAGIERNFARRTTRRIAKRSSYVPSSRPKGCRATHETGPRQ